MIRYRYSKYSDVGTGSLSFSLMAAKMYFRRKEILLMMIGLESYSKLVMLREGLNYIQSNDEFLS